MQVNSFGALQEVIRDPDRGGSLQPCGFEGHLARGLPPKQPVQRVSAPFLNSVEAYPQEDLTITVKASVALEDLDSILKQGNQWMPAAHQVGEGTVGGWIASDRRGPLTGCYGSVRDHLLSVEWMDGEGRLLRAGAPVVKSVAGYDFMKLMAGSLGALGFITQATFKVLPRPQCWGVVEYENLQREDVRAVREAAIALLPAFLLLTSGEGNRGAIAVGFCGNSTRVSYQVKQLARAVPPARWEEGESCPHVPCVNQEELLWGGVLPGVAGDAALRMPWEGRGVVDLLRGSLWLEPKTPLDQKAVDRIRAWVSEGAGHLHVDSFTLPSWGRESPHEIEVARKIKGHLDPRGTWVSGRLPGGV